MTELDFIIYGQTPSKKREYRIGKGRLFLSKEYRDWERTALWQLKEMEMKHNLLKEEKIPMLGPVAMKCVFYRHTKRKIDYVNLLNTIADVLQAARWIKDDSQIASVNGSRLYFVKGAKDARVEILLKSFDNKR